MLRPSKPSTKKADTIEHRTRALAYEQALERLTSQVPDDREATIFYALALNATALPSDKTSRASAEAAREKLSTTHQQGAGLYNALHALDYMMYGYLQLGQDGAAKRVLDEILAIHKLDVENFAAAYAFAAIPARYALERRQWAEAAQLTLHPRDLAWQRFP
ncbi:MAG: hypothetical protein FJZ47_02605 [Candidatus Tectomicrobia bacterium]|uniref:Uncharacterized protein n=1 Tax=Tectimicrobiota bacterium TaxID=2528274 RepID=A0A937VY47_UNCTE|nr:hypothetical protein [Candidatus Tectomicrobia bacterium]